MVPYIQLSGSRRLWCYAGRFCWDCSTASLLPFLLGLPYRHNPLCTLSGLGVFLPIENCSKIPGQVGCSKFKLLRRKLKVRFLRASLQQRKCRAIHDRAIQPAVCCAHRSGVCNKLLVLLLRRECWRRTWKDALGVSFENERNEFRASSSGSSAKTLRFYGVTPSTHWPRQKTLETVQWVPANISVTASEPRTLRSWIQILNVPRWVVRPLLYLILQTGFGKVTLPSTLSSQGKLIPHNRRICICWIESLRIERQC